VGAVGRRSPEMLRSVADFEALRQGSRGRSDALVAVRVRETGLPTVRVGFATGRKLGGAVVRNRVRRRLRHIVRAQSPRLAPGRDILIVVRPAGATVDQARLADSLERALRGLGAWQGEMTDR
jgi:ribonuclease P protein component